MAANMGQPETIDQEPVEVDMEGAVAIANAPNDEPSPPPPICEMDIDCCEETFDYLPLKDLRAVGQTCKRMYAVAVHNFKESYPGVVAILRDDTIKTTDGIQLHGYTRIIRSIFVREGKMCDFDYIATNKFGLLKHIKFIETDLSRTYIDRIREVLGQIETLELTTCSLTGDLYEDILQFCVNLKHLYVWAHDLRMGAIIGNGNEWFEQKYPKLEQLNIRLWHPQQFAQLSTFLAKNRHIRKLTIDPVILQANRASIMASDLKLDCLEINLNGLDIPFEQLNELHAKGVYQRLEISNIFDCQRISLLHGLERIQFHGLLENDVDYSHLADLAGLKQLEFMNSIGSSTRTLAKQLINLERVHYEYAHESDIRDLICYWANLKAIRGEVIFKAGYAFGERANCYALLELPKWNTERAKLNSARKVKIFVNEQVYLKTKWALKATDFGLIEIKRMVADQYNHLW